MNKSAPCFSLMTIVLVIVILAVLLFLFGMFGYHKLFKLDWVDSFYAAALTMAGLSLEVAPETSDQKVFVGIFTLFSVGLYLILIAAVIACLLKPSINKATLIASEHPYSGYNI